MNGKAISEHAAQVALQAVRQRIADAAARAQRSADSVNLLAVSKTFPAANVITMADCGQRAFGENYLQEALDKQMLIRDQRPDLILEWHFIGAIQSNKTKPVAENFDWVHTIEREKIARRLNDQRPDALEPLNVCIQVNIDNAPTKSGCAPDQTVALAAAIAAMPQLRLRGLMAIPEPAQDIQTQQAVFQSVADLMDQVRARIRASQEASADRLARTQAAEFLDTLSVGMSGDLESAVAAGSTMVRVGTALFGQRTPRGDLGRAG